jgi:hypothetical protein
MIHKFKVRQRAHAFRFPLDMLRYDCCWPRNSEDASSINLTFSERYQAEKAAVVELSCEYHKDWKPTAKRWESFGWEVIEHSNKRSI